MPWLCGESQFGRPAGLSDRAAICRSGRTTPGSLLASDVNDHWFNYTGLVSASDEVWCATKRQHEGEGDELPVVAEIGVP
jgi:hypothetical protein